MSFAGSFSLRRLGFVLFSALLLLGLSGCGEASEIVEDEVDVSVSENQDSTIRFLYSDWPPDLIAYLAEQKGFFEKHNANVELIQVGGYDELLDKKDDPDTAYVWSFTLLDFVAESITNPDAVVLAKQDSSFGADAVIAGAGSNISSITELEGKKIGVEEATVGEFFLSILLENEGLALDDLDIVSLTSEEIPAALANGSVDVGVAYEPDVTTAVNEGGTILKDSTDQRGVIVDIYGAKRDHVEANREEYTAFLKALFEAVEFYNNNPDESIDIMKNAFETDPTELKQTFEKLKIADLRDNQTAFNRSSGFESLPNSARQAGQYLEDQGLEQPDYDNLFADIVENL